MRTVRSAFRSSIPPGDDPNHYESASERWSPIQSVEKILISVMSMLAEPNDESPANVEAAKMWRERKTRVREESQRWREKVTGTLTACLFEGHIQVLQDFPLQPTQDCACITIERLDLRLRIQHHHSLELAPAVVHIRYCHTLYKHSF